MVLGAGWLYRIPAVPTPVRPQGPERQGRWFSGAGSSTRSRASLNVSPKMRLVMLVFRKTWILAWGTWTPVAVGVPPVHRKTTSPTSSVTPSARTIGGTLVTTLQPNGGD